MINEKYPPAEHPAEKICEIFRNCGLTDSMLRAYAEMPVAAQIDAIMSKPYPFTKCIFSIMESEMRQMEYHHKPISLPFVGAGLYLAKVMEGK